MRGGIDPGDRFFQLFRSVFCYFWRYRGISEPGMGHYLPHVRPASGVLPRGNSLRSDKGQSGWGFHAVLGGMDPGGARFLSAGCSSGRCIFWYFRPGGGASFFPSGAGFVYGRRPSSDTASGVGVSTPCGAVWIRGNRFSILGGRIFRCMEHLVSGNGAPLYPVGAVFIFEPHPISDRSVGFGFPHRAGRRLTEGIPANQ